MKISLKNYTQRDMPTFIKKYFTVRNILSNRYCININDKFGIKLLVIVVGETPNKS